MRRITCAREPTIPGYHERLRDNQYNMVLLYLDDWKTWFKLRFTAIIDAIGDADAERLRWVEAVHPRRQLRRFGFRDIKADGRVLSHLTYLSYVIYKAKPGELLPDMKYLRAVGDCTTIGSIKLGYLMEYVKQCFEGRFLAGEGRCEFVKTPELVRLREVFRELIDPRGGFYFVFFSDDSCASFQCVDGILRANLDISACDGSNFEPIFKILEDVMSIDSRFNRDIRGAFLQLRAAAKIENPLSRSERIKIKPNGPVLYSGSVLTTSVNNMANTTIFLRLAERWNSRMTKAETVQLIRTCAEDVGFILKVDVCEEIGDIQFLKHSPCLNQNGEYDAVLNLGVLMRGYGIRYRDLPGRRADGMEQRTRVYNSEIVRGRVHSGDHLINDAFRTHIVDKRAEIKVDQGWLLDNVTGQQLGRVSVDELCRRYRLHSVQLEELAWMIRNAGPGDMIHHPCVDVIMAKDYSL